MEASFLKDAKVYGNAKLNNLLVNEFIIGHNNNLSQEDERFLNEFVNEFVKDKDGDKYTGEFTFTDRSRQKCKDLFVSISFRGKRLTWRDLPQDWRKERDLGPSIYNTGNINGKLSWSSGRAQASQQIVPKFDTWPRQNN